MTVKVGTISQDNNKDTNAAEIVELQMQLRFQNHFSFSELYLNDPDEQKEMNVCRKPH